MSSPSVRRLERAAILGLMMIFLYAPTIRAQVDNSSFDIRSARDVAASAGGALWMISPDGGANGTIQRLVASRMVTQPGGAARIAVDPAGNAWVVNAGGELWQWRKVGTAPETWVLSDLKAMDVGVGANGAVWAIGADQRVMRHRDGVWSAIDGAGTRIAVDPAGNPWVVNAANEIWHWNGSAWMLIPGKAHDLSVAPDGSVFIVGMTPKAGGFQILKLKGNVWAEVPGAAGIAVAATNSGLALAQAPQSQVITLSMPVLVQPPVTINNPTTVITQPTSITIQGTTSIPVPSPTGTSAQQSTTAPVNVPVGQLRPLFTRGQTHEARILKAMNYGMYANQIYTTAPPSASSLPALDRGFAQLAMLAAEAYYSQQPVTTDQALSQIGSVSDPRARRAVTGILGLLLIAKMSDRSTDPATVALRQYATQLYRNHKITAAKASLDQYLAWKRDPCGYEGKPAGECRTMANLFTTRTPPQDLFALRALGTMLSNNTGEVAAATAIAATAVTGAVAAAVTTAALGAVVIPATSVTASGIMIGQVTTSLFAAFGGTGGASAGSAAAIGAGWAGVAAAPIAAAVMVIVVGTTEGIKVVEAARVEPMLRLKLGAAMTESIVIQNALTDTQAANFFFLAFENAAANRFAIPANNVAGEVRFYNQAGYVSRFTLAYTLDGSRKTFTTPALSVGNDATFAIPAAANAIVASGEWFDLVNWKSLFSRSLPQPTFIGFTSYGTVFAPSVKDEYPEISNIIAKPNELTVTQGGGYVARIRVTYQQGGRGVTAVDNSDAAAGWRQVFTIPADATNIRVEAWTRTGLVWEPWKGIIDKSYPAPPNECIKVHGTTLDPKWNNECR